MSGVEISPSTRPIHEQIDLIRAIDRSPALGIILSYMKGDCIGKLIQQIRR